MTTPHETIERAYGNVPKELPGVYIWDWIPGTRGIKYYVIRLVRKFTR
jgi:hypothetical protein